MEPRLKRLMQESGLLESSGSDHNDDIGDYSASSEDEWIPDTPERKKIKVLADVHLPTCSKSSQVAKRTQIYDDITKNKQQIGKPMSAMSMKNQDFDQFSLYKVGFSRLINEAPDYCYDAPLTIKAAKVKDVKRLLEHVPETERYFYEDLFHDNQDPISEEIDFADEVE